jgi:predicted nucleic acid-binding protein
MNAKRLLIDTNIAVSALEGNLAVQRHLNKFSLAISIVTEIELLSAPAEIRTDRLMRDFIASCQVININSDVKEKAAQLRRDWKMALPEAVIAASAIVNDIEFYTADRYFNKIQDPLFKLSLLNK